jgi:hypothetical protein
MVKSVYQNTSYHLAAIDYAAANNANTKVNFNIDAIATMTLRGRNSTQLGVATQISNIMAASSTNTEVALNVQAATARSIIYDPVMAVQYNLLNFSSVKVIGKSDIACPARLAAPATTIVNGSVITKCFDLGAGKSISDYSYSSDYYLEIVAVSGVNPASVVYVTVMERAPYLVNGQIQVGMETNAQARPTYSSADATYTVEVG